VSRRISGRWRMRWRSCVAWRVSRRIGVCRGLSRCLGIRWSVRGRVRWSYRGSVCRGDEVTDAVNRPREGAVTTCIGEPGGI
jgi:hypothetical protein